MEHVIHVPQTFLFKHNENHNLKRVQKMNQVAESVNMEHSIYHLLHVAKYKCIVHLSSQVVHMAWG